MEVLVYFALYFIYILIGAYFTMHFVREFMRAHYFRFGFFAGLVVLCYLMIIAIVFKV